MRTLINLFFLTCILMACLLSACSESYDGIVEIENSIENTTALPADIIKVSNDVSQGDVNRILDCIFPGKSIARTNERTYNINVIKDNFGKDCIISINYSDNKGFALLSATKTHEPILAYAESGNFNCASDSLPFPLNEWYESTLKNVSQSYYITEDSLTKVSCTWRAFESQDAKKVSRIHEYDYDHSYLRRLSQEQVDKLNAIAKDSIDSWLNKGYRVYHIDDHPGTQDFPDMPAVCDFFMGRIYPDYAEDYWAISYAVERDITKHYGSGYCLETKWTQEYGYNQVFPFKPENTEERIPVGCGPIAVGQILYAFKYPTYFNWGAMSKTGYGNRITSDFLYDVFKKCNAQYNGKGGTGCSQSDRIAALKSYGYTCRQIDGKKISTSEMMYGTPAIIASYFDGDEDKGHAWIVEGVTQRQEYMETEYYSFTYEDVFESVYYEESYPVTLTQFYVNWGWGGKYDGYYSLNYMKPANHTTNTYKSALVGIRPNR